MYQIIGADQKEYGPVPGDTVREWIRQQRANAQTLARADETEPWRPLGSFPEFAADLAAQAAMQSAGAPAAEWSPECIRRRDYQLSLGDCLGRSWQVLTEHLGLFLLVGLIYLAIEGALGGLGNLPFIGPIFWLAHVVVLGPLLGGMYYVWLGTVRGQRRDVGDVLAGFRLAFGQLFLGQFVPSLLTGLSILPALVTALLLILPAAARNQPPGPVELTVAVTVGLLGLILAIFLNVNWIFTLPLIMDRRMEFWPAMRLSWHKVRQHWWIIFLLTVLVGLLNLAGLAVCCVGLLFTIPLGIGVLACAYETIFHESGAPG